MRPRLWIPALLGVFGAVRLLRRRREPAGDPAAELRAKLDEARETAADRDEFEAGETPVDAAAEPPSVEERRRSVHDEARAAIDDMRDSG